MKFMERGESDIQVLGGNMLNDPFSETLEFLEYYNPENITNWLPKPAFAVLLAIVSEVRTRSPGIVAWAERILRYLVFDSEDMREIEIQQNLGKFISWVSEQIVEINEIAALAARAGVAWRDGLTNPISGNVVVETAKIAPNGSFDAEAILKSWISVAPVNVLIEVSNGLSERSTRIAERIQAQFTDLKLDQLDTLDSVSKEKIQTAFEAIYHDSQVLVRVAQVGVAYYKTTRNNLKDE